MIDFIHLVDMLYLFNIIAGLLSEDLLMDVNFDELIQDHVKWPFSTMKISETVAITDYHGKDKYYVQRLAHNYGKQYGRRFKTKTSGGVLYVKRIS